MILILSDDPVAAALLGALIETFDCNVSFGRPAETPEQSIRRVRPKVCFVDCGDPRRINEEMLRRAAMRSVAVVVYGTEAALASVGALAVEHQALTLGLPTKSSALEETLERALRKAS